MIKSTHILVFIFLSHFCLAQKSSDVDGDVRMAIVQYGDNYLIPEEFGNLEAYSKAVDSLIENKSDKLNEFLIIKKCLFIEDAYREYVIDSLFGLQNISYDLINELQRVNFFSSNFRETSIARKKQDLTGNSEFPSNEIYQIWNTKKIWNHIDEISDSSYVFEIISDDSPFIPPVCVTSMKKYNGLVTSHQGWRNGRMHNGVDIYMDQWDSVQCAFNGKVRFAREYEGFGKVVVVRHYNGLETLYAHLARIKVKPGQEISAGDLIGLAGSTGSSEGSHLHFEVRYLDKVLNPENIIDFKSYSLRSDSLFLKRHKNGFIALPATINFHIIERGDYPLKICNRYGIDLATLCDLNNITSRTKLKVGEKVIVK